MHLTDEERGIVVAWAKQIPELRAVFLYVGLAEGIADSVLKLALSIDGIAVWRLAFFLSKRRMWRTQLEAGLGRRLQLELNDRESATPVPDRMETGYIELWRT